MELNFTLIIQMVHFFIAYRVLRRYLFKPLVTIVHQEDTAMEDLEQAVQIRKTLVVQSEQSLQEQWENSWLHRGRLAPSVQDLQPSVIQGIQHSTTLPRIDSAQLAQLQKEVKEQLIKKVERVH